MQMLVYIGLLYFVEIHKLFTSIVLHMFLKKLKNLLGIKTDIKANIFREQSNNSIMCGYLCIGSF